MFIRTNPAAMALLMAGAAVFASVPAAARIVQLVVQGTVTGGSDGGNDLGSVDIINNVYVEHFIPGSIFGTIGDLTGKSVVFRLLYDTAEPSLPISAGGVFDDPIGDWAFTLVPTVAVGGVGHDFRDPFLGTFINTASAMLGVTDGTPDGLTGSFHNFYASGNSFINYITSELDFAGVLPASFFSTDTLLPGALGAPDFGFAHNAATGTGNFGFTRQTCFITCSSKSASAAFNVDRITFAPIPEPATWLMLLAGFAGVGTIARRCRKGAAVVIA